jgi:hypothetical protein
LGEFFGRKENGGRLFLQGEQRAGSKARHGKKFIVSSIEV